jgi:uncharacterized protein YndB with AHSA1/START domain
VFLEMKRSLPASPRVVFDAFTDPEQLRQWWGPRGFTVPAIDFPARTGADYRIGMQPPEGDAFHLIGTFRDVAPPARLVFTFIWEPADPDDVETVVELDFRGEGECTEIAYRQGPFKTEARKQLHHDGWTDTFDRLEMFLSR